MPLAWPVAVIAAVAAAAAWTWLGPRTVINAWIVALVPGVLLIPWTFHLATSPSAFFGEAGLVRPGLAAAHLRPDSLLLLSPGGPGLPPVWVTAGLVLPAFAALLLRRRSVLVYAGWGVALGALVLALVVSRATITPPQGGAAVSAWPGLAMAIAAAGLLLAATPLIETIGHALIGQAGRWRFAASVAGLAAVVSAPALAAGYWLAGGLGGPVTAAGPPILPPFVAASATGPDRARTLVLRQNAGTLSYAILRAADPVPGEPELAETAASRNAMANVVASLPAAGSGDAGDTGRALSQFGIGYVLLADPADPADQALAGQLNTAAGLQPLTRSSSYDLWQVSGTVARARVVTPSGTAVPVPSGPVGVNATLAPGTSGTVVLAEAAGGWSATLNGKPLAALAAPVNGWAQGFTLPAGGGHLVITRNEAARNLSLGAEAAALLVVLVLALPGSRSSVPVPAAQAAADTEAVPAAGRRRVRAAAGTTGTDTTGTGTPGTGTPGADTIGGDRRDRAEGTRSARRKRRPLPAMAGVTAARAMGAEEPRAMGAKEQSGARGQDSDETGAGYPLATRTATADPFGTDDDPGYEPDAGYRTDPGYAVATQGFGPRPGRQAPARTPEPALGVTPHLDEDPAPWEGLAPQIPPTPALQDRPAAEPRASAGPAPAPAAPAPRRQRPRRQRLRRQRPRRRGAAAVRTPPGTASRRAAGGVTADARRPPGARRGRPGRARCHRRRRPARPPRDGAASRDPGVGVLPGRDPPGAGDLGGPRLPARARRWRGPGRGPRRRIQHRRIQRRRIQYRWPRSNGPGRADRAAAGACRSARLARSGRRAPARWPC